MLVMSTTIAVGQSVKPVAGLPGEPIFGRYAEASAASGARFETSNPAVLRLGADGALTGITPGNSTVTVMLGGKRDSVNVTVTLGLAMSFLSGTDSAYVIGVNDSGHVLVGNRYRGAFTLIRGLRSTALGACSPRDLTNGDVYACGGGVYKEGGLIDMFASSEFKGYVNGLTSDGDAYGKLSAPDSLRGQGFLWRAGKVNVLLKGPSFMYDLTYTRVNAAGATLGQDCCGSCTSSRIVRATGWTLLEGLGRYDSACCLNDAGDAAGTTENMRGLGTAVIWPASSDSALTVAPGSSRREAIAISPHAGDVSGLSERGEVVGQGSDGVFAWKNGRNTVLAVAVAEKGWTFRATSAVSRGGVIAVEGTNTDGRRGVVLVTLL
jgi:hypothetical protein